MSYTTGFIYRRNPTTEIFPSIPFQRSFFYALLLSPLILLSNTCQWSVRRFLPSLDDVLMHIHQAKRQGNSLLVWNLNIATGSICSFIDVVAQGVLVRRKSQKIKPPGFSSHSSHSDIPLLGGVKPKTGCRS